MKELLRNRPFQMVVLLAIIFVIVSLTVSVKAAIVVVVLLAGLSILAGVLFLVTIGRQFRKLSQEFGQTLKGLESAFSLDIKLDHYPGSPPRNSEILRGLAEELLARGFTWAGFYKVQNQDIYVLGMAHPGLKVYALITECGEFTPPYAELSSYYVHGGAFCFSANSVPSYLPRPENMIQIERPGLRPAELLAQFLAERPTEGLVDTPPHGLVRAVEWETKKIKEHIASLPDDDEEDEDDDDKLAAKSVN